MLHRAKQEGHTPINLSIGIFIAAWSVAVAFNPASSVTSLSAATPNFGCSHSAVCKGIPRASASCVQCSSDEFESKKLVSAALQRFDNLAAAPEGCSLALKELEALKEAGHVFVLGPTPYNRAMRVCRAELEKVEALYAEVAEHKLQDVASLQELASARLESGRLVEAAAATAELLEKDRLKTSKSGKVFQRQQLPERTQRIALSVLDACSQAGLREDELSKAPEIWRNLGELGLWTTTPPPQDPASERTLALLKPDCLKAGTDGEIEEFIVSQGFKIVRRRQWRMEPAEASKFLRTSRGASWGKEDGTFFSSMVEFYTGGEVRALLLERMDAIAEWRRLLGPGDPAAGRGYTDHLGKVHEPKAPESVRARWGQNKRANAAHGADSPQAAAREIQFIFGEGWSEAGVTPEV